MRSIPSIFPAIFAALLFPAVLSCELDAAPPPAAASEDCEVTIRLSESGPASPSAQALRTVLPAASAQIAGYAFTGLGPGNASLDFQSGDPWLRTRLAPGDWSVSVRALNADGLVLLVGSTAFILSPGSAADIPISLAPREGCGSVRLSFALPEGLPSGASVSISLEPFDGAAARAAAVSDPFAPIDLPELPSGYYLLTARLLAADGGALGTGLAEALRVLPDVPTELTLDFASVPGSVSISADVPDIDPIAVSLPAWTEVSADEALPLEALADAGALSWFLDGLSLAGPALEAPLAAGFRRVDALAVLDGGRRSGSASALLEVFPALSSGALRLIGAFAPVPLPPALPADHSFFDCASSADGRIFAALDGPLPGSGLSGTAAQSFLHLFSISPFGTPFFRGAVPLRAEGSTRTCDSLRLSPDGASFAAWKLGSSWLVYGAADPSSTGQTYITAAALSLASSFTPKDVAFSADGRALYVLTGTDPYRIVRISFSSGTPAVDWTVFADDPMISSATFSSMAVDSSGALLLLSSGSDIAVLFSPSTDPSAPPALAAAYRRTQTGQAWLVEPVACCAASPSAGGVEFLFSYSGSAAIGRIGIDAAGVPYIAQETSIAVLSGPIETMRLAPGGERLAVSSAAGPAVVSLDGGAASFLSLPYTGALTWISPTRILSCDTSARRVAALGVGE